jgi:succinate dehydrogenase/fumarate reductase flavoprotein subunit
MSPAETFDVIVIGFGFAGGVAAIEAHDAGASVLLLEKQPDPGGISVCSAGGIRTTTDPAAALAYLRATNAETTPEPVLAALADGMARMPDYVSGLGQRLNASVGHRPANANYPFPGYDSFGFVYVDAIPGFDAKREFPAVRGAPAGAMMFKLVLETVRARPGITVRLSAPVSEILRDGGEVCGVVADGKRIAAGRGVVLACGGFEGAPALQRQHWSIKPVLSAAVRSNTGDGIRMAQMLGADLWHLWHFHGSYGFRHPDPAYPFGIRLKRLPDWLPGQGLREDVKMSWILLDRAGRRFWNEYDPYMQDTGHRALETFDPVTQDFPRIPALLLVDAKGRELYPLSAPTWHDAEVAERFSAATPRALDEQVLFTSSSLDEIAARFDIAPAALAATVAEWNAACDAGVDTTYGRPPGSMMPLRTPPFSAAQVWPVVSNTQGGPVHDEQQRVLDANGAVIPRLFEAGEVGSVFGHLYMSGGNLAECFVGGGIAGRAAAALPPRET